VLATLEWRPEYQADILTFVRAMGQVPELAAFLEGLVQHRSRKVVVSD
jgi:hypothetical protein